MTNKSTWIAENLREQLGKYKHNQYITVSEIMCLYDVKLSCAKKALRKYKKL